MIDDQIRKKTTKSDEGEHDDGKDRLAFHPFRQTFFSEDGTVRAVARPDNGEGVGRLGHQRTIPSESFMRGSMTSLTACAARLLSMTMAPVMRTMSISRL